MSEQPARTPEFVFELRVCAWVERRWPPAGDRENGTDVLVARQLGTRARRWDTIVIEADREALRRRARFGSKRLDSDLLHVVRNAPAEWTYYREALPEPGYPWRYVREAVHRAADRGIVERRKNANRIELRRKRVYPEWVSRVIAIENKPDLNASAARALSAQLQYDVALSLADEVWVATRATNAAIEPVLFEEIPTEAGVLALSADGGEVLWHPSRLDSHGPGTEIIERPSRASADRSAARFEYRSAEEKRETRLAVAERAYERGWRSYIDSMRSDCRHFSLRRDRTIGSNEATGETGLVPFCAAKERPQTSTECTGSCRAFEPEPPAWRTRGWPIEGGPGTALERLLETRRERRRPAPLDS